MKVLHTLCMRIFRIIWVVWEISVRVVTHNRLCNTSCKAVTLFVMDTTNVDGHITINHADNAMIRKYSDKPFYIRYPCRNKEGGSGWIWLLSPGGITTVIDYGMSHIELEVHGKRTHFGHCGHSAPLREYGIYRDKAHPMHDVYKHLCMCLAEMARKGNTACYEQNHTFTPVFQYNGGS